MLSSLNSRDERFLIGLNRIASQMEKAQRNIGSGVKMNQVSESPDQVSLLLGTRANLSSAEQIQTNLGRVRLEVDASEQALQSAVVLFDRVQSLGTQANTDTQTTAGKAAIAGELGSILQQLAGLASTSVEGRYVFSGDSDGTAPYSIDLSQANPVSTYQGSAATRVAQHPNGTTFQIGQTAQAIFDSPTPATNVFQSVVSLRAALLANDRVAVEAAFGNITSASKHLTDKLAAYGTDQNRVSEATDFGATLGVQLKAQISSLESADLTESILMLNQAQNQQQAALQARAKTPNRSLFDFLA